MSTYDATRFALESRILRELSAAQIRWTVVFHGCDRDTRPVLGRALRPDDFRMANRRLAAYRRLAARHGLT